MIAQRTNQFTKSYRSFIERGGIVGEFFGEVAASLDTAEGFARHSYWLDRKRKMTCFGKLDVYGSLAGQGLARELVEAREEFCRQTGIKLILINYCTNPEFWQHLGYSQLEGVKEKRSLEKRLNIKPEDRPNFWREPHYKQIIS